jgi:hypothetical protein
MSPEVAENQYFIFDVTEGHLPGPEPELAGRMPPTFPPPNLSVIARKLLKINILYSMSRRVICQARSQNARGECPQLFHRQTCPMSPEVTENQYFIFDVAAGYLPSPRPNLAGGCPEPTSAKPCHYRQNLLKINILYSISRRAVFVFLVGANS